MYIDLQTKDGKEKYSVDRAKMMVSNLVVGEKYIEAYGKSDLTNLTTNESCTIEYKPRSWTENTHEVSSEIKDADGVVRIRLSGSYTGKIVALDLRTNKSWVVFEVPKDFYPEKCKN